MNPMVYVLHTTCDKQVKIQFKYIIVLETVAWCDVQGVQVRKKSCHL